MFRNMHTPKHTCTHVFLSEDTRGICQSLCKLWCYSKYLRGAGGFEENHGPNLACLVAILMGLGGA